MALPELDVARVQRWCAARVPEHARHQVRVECEVAPRHLTIVERRAPWREDFGPEWTAFPIARLRYTAADKSWTLYWRDRNLRFHLYEPMAPSHRVEDPRHHTAHLPPLRWGQLQPSRRGQFRLTSPLGETCQRRDIVGDMAIERLSELLQSGGVFVPLHTLTQLTSAVLIAPQIDRIVRQLRNDSQSWRIRKRAAQLLG
jgi:hypothetical protein